MNDTPTPEQINTMLDKADRTMAQFLKRQQQKQQEEECDHRWRVVAREEVLSYYSPIDLSDSYLELDYSETVKVLEIERAECMNCGEEASDETVEVLKKNLPG